MALLTEAQRTFARFGVASDDLRWTGRPPSGIRLRAADIFLIPFSLMWGGFAIFWETAVISSGAGFFAIWGIPFVLIGIYLIAGRFFWDAYRRSVTRYGLTADSALIVRGGLRPTVRRIFLPTVSSLSLNLRADGSGTIWLGDSSIAHVWSSWASWSGESAVPCFEAIPEAQSIYDLCIDAQRIRSAAPPTVRR